MAVARVKFRVVALVSAILVAIFFGNILLMSTFADVASVRIAGSVSVGILYSIFVIFAGAGATMAYSWWANHWLDPATEDAAEKIRRAMNSEKVVS